MIDEPIIHRRYNSTTTKQIMNDDLIIGNKYCSCKTPRKKFRRCYCGKLNTLKGEGRAMQREIYPILFVIK